MISKKKKNPSPIVISNANLFQKIDFFIEIRADNIDILNKLILKSNDSCSN